MSITEKELADFLREEGGENARMNGWPHVARQVAAKMGVELKPEKPEPGTWHLTDEGQPAFVDNLRWLRYVRADGVHNLIKPEDDWPALTPARVIPETAYQILVAIRDDEQANTSDAQHAPAEPPVLTEDDYEPIALDEARRLLEGGALFSDDIREAHRMGWDAALAKHAHAAPVELPDWDDVRNAVAENKGNGWGLNDDAINAITDSVVALLSGESND